MNYAKRIKPRVLAGGGFLNSILGGGTGAAAIPPGVGTAASMMAGLVTSGIAQDKASKAKMAMLNQMWEEKSVGDAQVLDDYDTNGQYVEYFANGGNLPTASIKGKFATKGGKAKMIGDGVEEIQGNTHGENKIDNTNGVKLINKQTGLPEAEVEDKEVIVDGEYVFSDRLKADAENTFAKKMKKLTLKRNNIEEELESTTDTKNRNGLQRTLDGISMKENSLVLEQEVMKASLGQTEQMPIMAYGGGIGDPTNPTPAKPKVAFNPGSEDFLPVRKIQRLTNPDGSESYQYFYDKLPNEEGYSEDMNSHIYSKDEHINKTSKQSPEYSKETEAYLKKTGTKLNRDVGVNYQLAKPLPKLAIGGDIPSAIGTSYSKLGRRLLKGVGDANLVEDVIPVEPTTIIQEPDGAVGEAYKSAVTATDKLTLDTRDNKSVLDYAAPTFIDNAMNLGLTMGSPKLPKPIYKRARSLKTNVNVNPQVGAVKNAVSSTVDNIAANTSSSNIARANMASARLRGSEQLGAIYANKENIETQLKNSDTMNKQGVDFTNVDMTNNQNMLEFTRDNDISSRLSANVADLSKNLGEAQTKTQLDSHYDEIMLLELLNDKTGDKARAMSRNPYALRSAKLRAALAQENKRLNR
jgi:hypothetical protein